MCVCVYIYILYLQFFRPSYALYEPLAILKPVEKCARTQSLVHGQPLEITISQHVDTKQF